MQVPKEKLLLTREILCLFNSLGALVYLGPDLGLFRCDFLSAILDKLGERLQVIELLAVAIKILFASIYLLLARIFFEFLKRCMAVS